MPTGLLIPLKIKINQRSGYRCPSARPACVVEQSAQNKRKGFGAIKAPL